MEGTFFIGDSVANNLRRSKLDGGYNGPYLVMSIGDTRFKTGNDFRSGTDPGKLKNNKYQDYSNTTVCFDCS